MKKQIGVIVLGGGINPESFKTSFIEDFENVDPIIKKPLKIEFVEGGEEESDRRWIEVWGE